MMQEDLKQWIKQGNVSVSQLFFHHYSKLHIAAQEAIVLLQIHSFAEQQNFFPTHYDLAERMGISAQDIGHTIQKLMQRGLIEIHQTTESDGVLYEKYSLLPLWERVIQVGKEQALEQVEQREVDETGVLYQMFEQEFARPLSPMESEMIGMWLDEDGQSVEVIQAALREAVLAQKMSFKYIDRILHEWKRKNVKSMHDVRREAFSYVKPAEGQRKYTKTPNAPLYNWLEED